MKRGTRTTLIIIGVIALMFIFFAFFTETEIRIEVNTKDATTEYTTFEECLVREMQKCPTECKNQADWYCESLELPAPTFD